MLSITSGFDVCKTSLLSNHPKRPALRFVRGAHHRRCAREGLTWFIMPYGEAAWQAHFRALGPKVWQPFHLSFTNEVLT